MTRILGCLETTWASNAGRVIGRKGDWERGRMKAFPKLIAAFASYFIISSPMLTAGDSSIVADD
jgi:hypothetical protein